MNSKLRRLFVPLVALACVFSKNKAYATTAGICTTVVVGTAAATVLAANTSSYPRKRLVVQMVTNTVANAPANFAWCTVGGTAANNVGYMIFSAASANTSAANVSLPNTWELLPVQQSTNTWAQVPNGAVSCIANVASQTITACVY